MLVTNKITIRLDDLRPMEPVSVMQCDVNTRALEITLLSGEAAWNVPDGVTAISAYTKPDGTKGLYDTLPDGTDACTISGNVVTAVLPPQALTVPGDVDLAVIFTDDDQNQLAAFAVPIKVRRNPAVGAVASGDYFNLQKWIKEAVANIAVPTALPNPQKLILTGAVEAEYDGSAEVTVEIPEGGSGGSAEVHIGSDEPTGDEVVWINAEGDADGGFIPAPATAEVGQTIVVKAVDEDGKPTEWECADVATGGSGALEHIRTIELTEEVAQIVVDTDADGNALNLSNIVLAIYTVGGTNNTATSTYYCYPNSINAGAIRFANENGVYAAGKTVRSIVDITLLDTGTYYTRHGVNGSSAMKWNRYGSEASIKSVTLYLDTDSYTFGVGTKIVVSGVWK